MQISSSESDCSSLKSYLLLWLRVLGLEGFPESGSGILSSGVVRNPQGNSKSLCNTRTGAFLSWEQTLYTGRFPTRSTTIWMEGSHLSASLCFPLIRTFLTRTLSPTSRVDSFTRLSNLSLFLIADFEAF